MTRTGPDFGADGLVGVLTPRENPTVEPELSVLAPPDVALLTARMQSPAPAMTDRLVDYARDLPHWVEAFGQAPLQAVAFACTGTSYLLGAPLPERVEQAGRSVPFLTAAGAVEATLQALGARTLALVDPYPEDLTAAAVAHWRRRGFAVGSVHQMRPAAGHHPIYSRDNLAALAAVVSARATGADAVLAMGTGAPTLAAIAVALETPGPPVLSSNLCLGWRIAATLASETAEPLSAWLSADAPWTARLATRFPAALERLR